MDNPVSWIKLGELTMECTRIRFSVIPHKPLSTPLPDGVYIFIAFSPTTDGVFGKYPNPYPWLVQKVRFSAGGIVDFCPGLRLMDVFADTKANSSIDEVLVVETKEMNFARWRELAEMLAVKNVELIDA